MDNLTTDIGLELNKKTLSPHIPISKNSWDDTNKSCVFDSIRVLYKKLHPDAILPTRALETDSGYDLYAIEDCVLRENDSKTIPTGIVMPLPAGYFGVIAGRSSMFKRRIEPMMGVIDATYCGEIKVALVNNGVELYKIKKGDRIAQMLIFKSHELVFEELEGTEFPPEYSKRGDNGFGSSGR